MLPGCMGHIFEIGPMYIYTSRSLAPTEDFFLFYIYKNTKFQKYMAVSRNFKNGPLSPRGGRQDPCRPGNGRQGPFCNFFFQKCFSKLAYRSLAGDVEHGGRSPPQRATGGACRPPPGDRVPPLYNTFPLIFSSFEPKYSTK